MVAAVADKRPLTLAAFERALLIAGDTAGLDLRTRLTVGDKPGAVKLVLEGAITSRWRSKSQATIRLSRSLGLWTATASGSLNSVFGFGEQIYLNLTGSPTHGLVEDDTPRRLAAIGVILPIGLDGLTLNLEGAWSQTKPISFDDAAIPTDTEYERLSLRLAYPMLRTRADTLMLHAAFDAIDETQSAPDFDVNLYKDAIRALRVGADWSHAFSPTTLGLGGLRSIARHFRPGQPGARRRGRQAIVCRRTMRATTSPSSRASSESARPCRPAFRPSSRRAGQYSFGEPLFKSEQFSIGGPHLLSAYDAGDIFGDSGWMLRGELRYDRTLQTTWAGGVVQPYLFGAHGQVFITDPTALETASVAASSFGLGARFTAAPNLAAPREVEIGIEGARQISNDIGEKDGWRFNLYLASRY